MLNLKEIRHFGRSTISSKIFLGNLRNVPELK